ncbi:DMT family transporter [Streptomyces smyrnaeus]|uniref:DMT family transporter n=1 Tax=Streptomyces TaxID=1883 RepID=UPI000C17B7D2|nr:MULTISPECIES: multidrug efflux SMR transporter [unclassified Streptomyces]MBQ0864999.1 multidrug efflux SMR transporter [Streptomyces sp. RK75]MBQ1123256.1 multidrug efflux SMR transporter [Streptomyces sp. B15]MBQ1158284.1 multidrug efflux SMR transporter [Streptomyces sp. A73]
MVYMTLAGAILAEILGTTSMKYSDGFTKLVPTLITAAGYLVAFVLLAQALKSMPVGTAYAIWSGAGTAAIALIGVVFIGESVTAAKILGLLLVICGVVVLNLGGAH